VTLLPPSLTVRRLLDEPALGLTTRAGADAVDRAVRWVHVSELDDPRPYLSGGELLCVTGLGLDSRLPAVRAYVARLGEAEVAALGFGIGPVRDAVPEPLVRACAEVGLPLLEVPRGVPFIALSERVAALLTESRVESARRVGELQRALTRAAGGARPVPSVLGRLASAVGGWALLLDHTARVRERAGAHPGDGAVPVALVRRVLAPGGPASAVTDAGAGHAVLHHVPAEPHASCLVVGRTTPFDADDRTVVGVAASLLTVLSSITVPDGARRVGALLTASALGDPGEEVGNGLASLLAREEDAGPAVQGPEEDGAVAWRVLRCRPGPDVPRGTPAALRALPLVAPDGEDHRVVLPDGPRAGQLRAALAQAGWHVGVSAACPWDALAEAGRQAERALARAVGTGREVDLGAPGGTVLDALVGPDEARAYARSVLEPLDAYDPGTRDVLRNTLAAWLAAHGRWDPAASALGVHRNTVRHRVASIARCLGRDLDDAGTRAALWFALDWEEREAQTSS
jgi:PucR family transcriptional regulator, purine catabolism regulatory protein